MSHALRVDVGYSIYDLEDGALDNVVPSPKERSAGNVRQEIAAFAEVEYKEVQAVLNESLVNREDVVVLRSCGVELRLVLEELGDVEQLPFTCTAIGEQALDGV